MWWVEKENGKLKLTFLSSGLLIGAVFYQYFFWCQQMCNVNTNAMFGEAMPLARWRVTDIHEYLLFLLSLENYYPWTNVETFRVHISLFIPFVQYKRIEQQPPQLRPQTFVTTWKDVNFLPNWKSLQFFSIPELSPCLSFSVTLLNFPPLFISQILTLSSLLWIKKFRCAFRVNLIRWSTESRLIPLKIPTVMRSLLDPAAEK